MDLLREAVMGKRQLLWDVGTGYDLFVSLHVLHNPAKFGLRGSWAAGVRSRLPVPDRKVLEQADHYLWVPVNWLYGLPAPKDGALVLDTLAQLPAIDRLPRLSFRPDLPDDMIEFLLEIRRRGAWGTPDQERLRAFYKQIGRQARQSAIEDALQAWSKAAETGEVYLNALKTYYEVFFAEEERRIQADLVRGLERAQQLAKKLDFGALLEELSQGVRFSESPEDAALDSLLIPSYWTTPLVIFGRAKENTRFFIFGARPPDASLVPGEMVPDKMLQALKALADPTRLRILRYLSTGGALTPTHLAQLLRLRAPTVVHHLAELRLAGLVQLTVEPDQKKGERRYAARLESVARLYEALQDFLARTDDA
jgi:DNA-binding transcriptional ArsR family regulator